MVRAVIVVARLCQVDAFKELWALMETYPEEEFIEFLSLFFAEWIEKNDSYKDMLTTFLSRSADAQSGSTGLSTLLNTALVQAGIKTLGITKRKDNQKYVVPFISSHFPMEIREQAIVALRDIGLSKYERESIDKILIPGEIVTLYAQAVWYEGEDKGRQALTSLGLIVGDPHSSKKEWEEALHYLSLLPSSESFFFVQDAMMYFCESNADFYTLEYSMRVRALLKALMGIKPSQEKLWQLCEEIEAYAYADSWFSPDKDDLGALSLLKRVEIVIRDPNMQKAPEAAVFFRRHLMSPHASDDMQVGCAQMIQKLAPQIAIQERIVALLRVRDWGNKQKIGETLLLCGLSISDGNYIQDQYQQFLLSENQDKEWGIGMQGCIFASVLFPDNVWQNYWQMLQQWIPLWDRLYLQGKKEIGASLAKAVLWNAAYHTKKVGNTAWLWEGIKNYYQYARSFFNTKEERRLFVELFSEMDPHSLAELEHISFRDTVQGDMAVHIWLLRVLADTASTPASCIYRWKAELLDDTAVTVAQKSAILMNILNAPTYAKGMLSFLCNMAMCKWTIQSFDDVDAGYINLLVDTVRIVGQYGRVEEYSRWLQRVSFHAIGWLSRSAAEGKEPLIAGQFTVLLREIMNAVLLVGSAGEDAYQEIKNYVSRCPDMREQICPLLTMKEEWVARSA